jgi:methionyl-tRNA synthetase
MSALGGPPLASESRELFDTFWPPSGRVVHLVGKDILRFHAIYWPAFLMSAGLEPPTQVWAHGWLTVDGQKMSKSLGNFIPPGPIADAVGADVLRYYLMRDVAFGQDGDFSHENLFARYHGDLGNGLGNLLNRMVASIVKNSFGGQVPKIDMSTLTDLDRALMARAEESAKTAGRQLEDINPNRALDAIWELVAAANKYVDQTEPWKLAKNGDTARLGQVVYTVLESLRFLGVMLWPFMPQKCDELLTQLGLERLSPAVGADLWPETFGKLPAEIATRPGRALFPRFEKDQQAALLEKLTPKLETSKATEAPMTSADEKKELPPPKPDVVFDDFMKVDLRVALIKLAERVPKSDKLLRLEVDLGPLGERQILAGIGKHYAPEELVGKRVVVIANLPPRKMMGLMSQGMVLAAGDGTLLSVLHPHKDAAPGSAIS